MIKLNGFLRYSKKYSKMFLFLKAISDLSVIKLKNRNDGCYKRQYL